jgi:hypothetical protein
MGKKGHAGGFAAVGRHSSIQTTMSYYVSMSADEIAGELLVTPWKGKNSQESNIPGNIAPNAKEKGLTEKCRKSLS